MYYQDNEPVWAFCNGENTLFTNKHYYIILHDDRLCTTTNRPT